MNSELLQTYDHYLYALVAMVGTGMGVIGLQWLMRYSRWAAWVRSLAGVAPPFINIIGVLFGLTLAFLANDTWSAHDRATNAVFREADALRSLVTLSASLPEPLQGRVRAAVVSYGQASAAAWGRAAGHAVGAAVKNLAPEYARRAKIDGRASADRWYVDQTRSLAKNSVGNIR